MARKQIPVSQKAETPYFPLHTIEPNIVDVIISRMSMKARICLRRTCNDMNDKVEHLYVPGEYSANKSIPLETISTASLYRIIKRMDKNSQNMLRISCHYMDSLVKKIQRGSRWM